MRSEFDKEKAEKMVAVKEKELEVRGLEKDLQSKEDKLQNRVKELDARDADFEQRVSENNAVRDNLEKQLKVVAKRKEELEAANEERIKALEGICSPDAKRGQGAAARSHQRQSGNRCHGARERNHHPGQAQRQQRSQENCHPDHPADGL